MNTAALFVSDFDRLIGEASRLAKTDDEKRRVKEAREALFSLRAHKIDFPEACRVMANLPIPPEAEDYPQGSFMVESSNHPGMHYITTAYRCSCEAGQHGKECRHVRMVRRGEATWRAVSSERASDPFGRIR
jgi:hypothetical protein